MQWAKDHLGEQAHRPARPQHKGHPGGLQKAHVRLLPQSVRPRCVPLIEKKANDIFQSFGSPAYTKEKYYYVHQYEDSDAARGYDGREVVRSRKLTFDEACKQLSESTVIPNTTYLYTDRLTISFSTKVCTADTAREIASQSSVNCDDSAAREIAESNGTGTQNPDN